jgi:hypothetical protein
MARFRKGRFRKGKKAHKQILAPRNAKQGKLAHRYEAWKTSRATLALKILQTMIVKRQSQFQIQMIMSSPRPVHYPLPVYLVDKALRVVDVVRNTAEAIKKIWERQSITQ